MAATERTEPMTLERLAELEDRLRRERRDLRTPEQIAVVDALHYVGSCIVYAAERQIEATEHRLAQGRV